MKKKAQGKEKVVAIVPAAGIGKRFGSGTNKPFYNLGGKQLIVWSLQVLESIEEIIEVIPVLKAEDMDTAIEIFEKFSLTKVKKIAPGGKERQDSVYNGLKLIEDECSIVLIHDGVRPLVERELVEDLVRQMSESLRNQEGYDGVIPGVPLKDTVKESEGETVKRTLKRSCLWAIQTPQVFQYKEIIRAYEKAIKERFYSTDDAALIEQYEGRIKIIMGSYKNIKITTPEDIAIAELFLARKEHVL